jgi:hypothetical protein
VAVGWQRTGGECPVAVAAREIRQDRLLTRGRDGGDREEVRVAVVAGDLAGRAGGALRGGNDEQVVQAHIAARERPGRVDVDPREVVVGDGQRAEPEEPQRTPGHRRDQRLAGQPELRARGRSCGSPPGPPRSKVARASVTVLGSSKRPQTSTSSSSLNGSRGIRVVSMSNDAVWRSTTEASERHVPYTWPLVPGNALSVRIASGDGSPPPSPAPGCCAHAIRPHAARGRYRTAARS